MKWNLGGVKCKWKKKGIKRENQNMENISFSPYQPCSEDPPTPTLSSTNLSSGEEGEGPKNEVDSLLSIVRNQKKSSKDQSVVVYFLTLLKMS